MAREDPWQARKLRPGIDFALRPELRIRDDAPSIEIDDTTPARRILECLGVELQSVVVRNEDGEDEAVMLTPERYAELAACEMHQNRDAYWELTIGPDRPGYVLTPKEIALEALMIEQVDPDVDWNPGAHMWPPKPYVDES